MAAVLSTDFKQTLVAELRNRVCGLDEALREIWRRKQSGDYDELAKLSYKEHELLNIASEALDVLRRAPRSNHVTGNDGRWLVVYDFPGCRTPRHFYRLLHKLEHVRYVSRSCVLVWDRRDFELLIDALRRYHARFCCFRVLEEVER